MIPKKPQHLTVEQYENRLAELMAAYPVDRVGAKLMLHAFDLGFTEGRSSVFQQIENGEI